MSYYLEKGHDADEICNLPRYKKSFYKASMLFQMELKQKQQAEFFQAIIGNING